MLPWKDTAFFKESKGFPSKSLMRFALGSDIIQASVGALCSIIYIGSAMASNAKNPTTSSEAQAFFGINISVSLLTVTMSFMLLYLKDRLLMMAVEQEGAKAAGVDAEKMHDNPMRDLDKEQGQVEGERQVEAAASGGESIVAGSHPESHNDDVGIEISHIYKDSATDVIPIRQNPMHDPEDVGKSQEYHYSHSEIMELKNKNAALELENKNIKESHEDMVSQNGVLKQRVQDLESQAKDYQEKDDEENL